MTEQAYRLHKAYEINDLASRCGYFWKRSPVNSGYGCMHPEQKDTENGLGRCYAFSCPLAYQQNSNCETDYVVTWRRTPDALPTPTPGHHRSIEVSE